MKPIPNENQMDLFKDLTPTLTTAEEQELQHMLAVRRINKGSNGTTANDLQIGGQHYKEMGVQPWDVMEAILTKEEFVGFLKGNIIKYSMRAGKKDSDDAGKAKHYMMKLKEVQRG